MKSKYWALISLFSISIISKAWSQTLPADSGKLILHFKNVVNGQPLRLNDTAVNYHNSHGDKFTINTFKYYISNIVLFDDQGKKITLPPAYFLINAADSTTFDPVLTHVPPGKYSAISLMIGVDSARNFAGAQEGCLDPAQGMFWTWNSGYIFLKLEGISPQSNAKLHRLTFHVGGVKPQNTIRVQTIPLKKELIIGAGQTAKAVIITHIDALFSGKNQVDFSRLSFTMGGPNAVLIADNYATSLFTAWEETQR
ncbi:hypothetical protein SAMN05216464_1297 [Mucilaginibacter pineti]|uniref:Copper-binding protein MbnP-like domain-containing protein n=1 Tax=Mucilaginibacter pineti TaxID=1391627 RepID=A0A1G7NSZ0_9SPHI|nr:MbnP family protein [Mucilaginibacter pineti]SDF76449.1 hypothetical protein SAMN05216464_1297 [Mucilaginibacter pineti]